MIAEAIFDWAKKSPDTPAVERNDEPWSYRVFANAIANARGYFRRQGLEGDGQVVVAVGDMRHCWVIVLALRSLGRTAVPVGAASVIAELALPQIRCVVCSDAESWPRLMRTCDKHNLELLSVPVAGTAPLDLGATAYPVGGHILLTSGTTGRYKKVLMDAATEAAFLRRRQAAFPTNRDTVANLFDFGAWTGLGYRAPACVWLQGGTVAFSQARPYHLALRRPGLTSSAVSPAMLTEILAAPEGSFPRSETMELRLGGSTASQSQIEEAKRRITPRVLNGLACTECHHIAMTPQNTPDDHRWHLLEPTTIVELVDEFDRPTPLGETGRLRISTEDAPTGYLFDEEASRTFFKNGFFYPGDLAVMREDGRIALQGRATDVINVKGNKISPAPIEDRMREALGVTGVCLLSVQNELGEEELHLVIEAPTPVDRAILAAVLPSELGAVHIARIPALPRNVMGKVVRHLLTASVIAARGD